MWSLYRPRRSALIWGSALLFHFGLALALGWAGYLLFEPAYPAQQNFSPAAQRLIMFAGAVVVGLFVLNLFAAPIFLSKAVRALRRMNAMEGPPALLARWTIGVEEWRTFSVGIEDELNRRRFKPPAQHFTRMLHMDMPAAIIDIRIGRDAVVIGDWFLSLTGSSPSKLERVGLASAPRSLFAVGEDLLIFSAVYHGHSKLYGPYKEEESWLILPVPRGASREARRVAEYYSFQAISALREVGGRRRRIGCAIGLALLAASLAAFAIWASTGDVRVGFFGLLLWIVWSGWMVFFLMSALIEHIRGIDRALRKSGGEYGR